MTTTTPRQQLGAEIKAVRQRRGLSINAVAKISGLTWAQVNSIEMGLTAYTVDSYLSICAALGELGGILLPEAP